jgi:hypothetical protein
MAQYCICVLPRSVLQSGHAETYLCEYVLSFPRCSDFTVPNKGTVILERRFLEVFA